MANGYYLFNCKVVNRGSQSAVAMSAYRSGEEIYSLRDGETKKYKERFVDPDSFILKPDNAPEWTLEREKLWNEVERYENRDNAQLARSILVALPNNMTDEQQLELTKEYVKENFVDEGMVADTSIHRDDLNNPHAHIMLTVRPFDEHGKWEKRKSKRVPVLDDKGNQIYNEKGWKVTRSVKVNDWDKRDTLNKWRKSWSEKLNEKSREFGLDKTYSHKSFEEQGKFKKAELRLTRSEYQYEKRVKNEAEKNGKEYKPTTYYAKKNEEIKRYNDNFKDVIHLEDYKQKKDYKDQLNDLRNKMHVKDYNVHATQLLTNRVKGYVDYQVAKNLYNDFTNERNKWKLKLERDTTLNESEKDLYSRLIKQYENNPSIVEKYGYSIEDFKSEMKDDLLSVKESEQKVSDEYEKFNELKQATITSLDYQKDLLDMEFSSVYEDVSNKDYSYDEKYFAMKLLKDHNILLPDEIIKDEFKKQGKSEDYNKQYIPVWKQAKDTMTSIDIYNRTVNKLKRVNVNEAAPEKLKDTLIKINSFNELKNDYEKYLKDVSPIIDNELQNISDNAELNNANLTIKVAVLEAYSNLDETEKDNFNIQEFIEDLQREQEQQAEQFVSQDQDENKKEIYKENAEKSKEIASGLFAVLNSLAQDKNSLNDRRKKDRTRVFRKRGADGREL